MSLRTLHVKVRPNARASVLAPPEAEGAPWTAQLKSPPVDGKANEELVGLLARHFGCAKAAVRIKAGAGARLKLVQLEVD